MSPDESGGVRQDTWGSVKYWVESKESKLVSAKYLIITGMSVLIPIAVACPRNIRINCYLEKD
jgi:hypothetical protein